MNVVRRRNLAAHPAGRPGTGYRRDLVRPRRQVVRARRAVLVLALTLGCATAARAGPAPPTFPGARSLLWVGAHPDDELLAAPLLARLCLDEELACTFLVLTRGEAGTCSLPGGCSPRLAGVRAGEMRRSARLFGARLEQWRLPDAGALPGWSAAAGGEEALLERIAATMESSEADVVLAFDPRHGSTCHGDHRAAGHLAIEAARRLGRAPAVVLVETVAVRGAAAYSFHPAADARAGVLGFDANANLASAGQPAWETLLAAARIHASQFDAAALERLARVPRRQRAVWIAPAALALAAELAPICD